MASGAAAELVNISTATNSHTVPLTVTNGGGANNSYAATFMGGNVGIGVTNPVDPLVVYGAGGSGDAMIFENTSVNGATSIEFQDNNGNQQAYLGWGNASGAFAGTFALGTSGSNPVLFVVNSGEVARFSGAGKLGIGTPSPSALLTVAGTLTATGTTTLSGLTTAGVVLNSAAGVLSTSEGTTGQFLEATTGAAPVWAVPTVALNNVTAAGASSTIDNKNYAQVWNWSTLATGTALTLADTDASATTAITLAVTSAATGAGAGISSILGGTGNSGAGVYGVNSGTSNSGTAVYALNSGAGSSGSAVYGINSGTGNSGIAGIFANTDTSNTGAALALKNSSASGFDLVFFDFGDTNATTITAPATMATSQALILPSVAGTSGEVLTTNGSGTLSWGSAGNGENVIIGGGGALVASTYYPLAGSGAGNTTIATVGGTPIPIAGILRNFCVRTAATATASTFTLYDYSGGTNTNTGITVTIPTTADHTTCDNTDTYTIAANDAIVVLTSAAETAGKVVNWSVEFDPGTVPPSACTGTTPTFSAAFTNQTGDVVSTLETSNCVEVTGLTCSIGTAISGSGSPQYQIWNDATCGGSGGTVVVPWTNRNSTISNAQSVELRQTSSASAGFTQTNLFTANASTDLWSVTTTGASAPQSARSARISRSTPACRRTATTRCTPPPAMSARRPPAASLAPPAPPAAAAARHRPLTGTTAL